MAGKKKDPRLPFLALIYGGPDKRTWLLNQDAMTVGRAHGCDISLQAPDVSSLHCLIWRTSGGLCVRDCGSRAGTHLNGAGVLEATLHDRDILQVGPFTFEVSVPALGSPPAVREARVSHCERSRQRLVRLALTYRRRLRALQQIDDSDAALNIDQKASGLRRGIRAFQQRLRQLEQAERDLSRDREAFDRELQVRLERLKQADQDLKRRRNELDHAGAHSPNATNAF